MTAVQWISLIGGVAGLLAGLGGAAQIVRARTQNRRDDAEADAVAQAAHTDEWDRLVQRIYDTQVKPLEERIARQDDRIDGQDRKIAQMDEEIQAWRSRYWSAIEHIRRLMLWITRHMPDGTPSVPTPPATIADDI